MLRCYLNHVKTIKPQYCQLWIASYKLIWNRSTLCKWRMNGNIYLALSIWSIPLPYNSIHNIAILMMYLLIYVLTNLSMLMRSQFVAIAYDSYVFRYVLAISFIKSNLKLKDKEISRSRNKRKMRCILCSYIFIRKDIFWKLFQRKF